ncbi:MAG TPA: 5'-methylthioadenosine/adenosylhomocysteine nucleosidase [Cytophagaceae bacterium]|jgi:adenosylhomocysteine nucleosidase|nr:5'-methylthioadenosine/adenosylhomocysteine nucleosidase [Cytophagaceae bacterium]
MLIGILAPMPEEIALIVEAMTIESVYESGGRKYYKGIFQKKACVVALSRIGKVASSVTAAVMIEKFGISLLIVCGVAGAIAPHLKMGDIVVADECVQHDLDARPLFPQFEAPLLGKGFFTCDPMLVEKTLKGCTLFLQNDVKTFISEKDRLEFSLSASQVYKGQLCCGDQFIGSIEQLKKIRSELPETLCVEMEGGAVGQICYEYNIPYVVVRTISDGSDDKAHINFGKYIESVAKYYTLGIVGKIVEQL